MDSEQQKTPVGGASVALKVQRYGIGVLLLVLMITGWSMWNLYQQNMRDKETSTRAMTTSTACSQELLDKAATALINQDDRTLSEAAAEVRSTEDHMNDPNCLFVLLKDADQRQRQDDYDRYKKQFEKTYDPHKGLNKVFEAEDTQISAS